MSLRRVAAIVLRQYYLLRGSAARLLPLFVWVVIDITLWGFMSKWLDTVASQGVNFVPALLGAVLLWDFLIRVMQGVSMAFLEDVWTRNFLNVFATPLRITEYLAGLVVTSIGTSAVGLLVMLVMASAIFGLSLFAYGLPMVPFLLVLFLFGITLGVVAVAIVLRFGPAAEWFVWPIPAFVSPFAGVFYPVAALPAWMRGVARLVPPSYVFEGVRTIAAGGAVSWGALGQGVALALLYLLAACWYFSRVHRRVLRTGLIARYSAESVN